MSGFPSVRERQIGCLSTSPSLTPISQELVFSCSVTVEENTKENKAGGLKP